MVSNLKVKKPIKIWRTNKRITIILSLIFAISLLTMGFVSAQVTYSSCEIYGNCKPVSSIIEGTNYTINVNNSEYLQGYTPTTLKNWIQNLFN